MHTIAETRRDLSSQIDNFPPNLLNNLNASAQNRGGGDGATTLNTGQTMIPFVGQQPINLPSCRNTSNYFHAERNDSVRHLWRQQTHSCISQSTNSASGGNQLLPTTSSPQQSQAQHQQQHCGVVNHFGSLEQSQQLYRNLSETNAAYNRQTQFLNNALHIEQNRRNYLANTIHNNLLQQEPATMDRTLFLNFTSNNISQYPNQIGGNANNSIAPYPTVPQQYNYQNISPPVHNNINNTSTQQQSNLIPPSNYPIHSPLPSPQLVFGPPPRENRRPNINQLDESLNRTIAAAFPDAFNTTPNPTYFHETSQSIPINSLFQSFSNHLKIPEQVALNRLAMSAQSNNSTTVNKSQIFNRNIEHQCVNELNECNNTQLPPPLPPKSCYMLPTTTDRNGDVLPDCIVDDTNQIHSARSNMKFKFSKNVKNIPKKIEKNDSDQSSSKESLKTCTSDLYISNSTKQTSQQYSEDIFNCQIRDCNTIYPINDNKEDTNNTNQTTTSLNPEQRHSSPFVLQEESAFIDMIVEGCIHGEEIATKYQNVPCFKNIKKLCEKTKSDLMTPHCTARNIHSQGIPWATKDYIFAFTRLTSCWYLLKGYLGQKSDVFDKIEQLYSPDLRRSFELWEQTTMNLAFHVMKSFIALGNNSTVKWNPNAHSTPLTTKETLIRKKLVAAFPSLISMDLDDNKNKSELEKNNSGGGATQNDNKSTSYFNNTNRMMKDFHNHHIIKPMSTRYDFDSGDEDSSKKYIKPGCYSVPQIQNPNTLSSPTASPRPSIFNDLGNPSSSNKKQMSPIIILSHRNEQAKQTIDSAADSAMKNNGMVVYENHIEYIPFKKTPQGIITSALMKKSRCEDFPKSPLDLNENEYSVESKMLYDALKITKLDDNQQQNDSNDVSTNNINLTVERSVEVDDHIECTESQVNGGSTCKDCKDDVYEQRNINSCNVSGFTSTSSKSTSISSPNKIYGTKKQYRNKSRRSDQHSTSDYQTKSASIKKAHKSYYNTILSSPKYLAENCNMKGRPKCRQNVKWNIWYSRKHDGLSHLAIETFERILHELWSMPSSHYFVFEVDVRDVPDYYEIIKHPINARIFSEVHPNKRLQRLIGHFSNAFEQLLNDNFPKMDFSKIMDEDNEVLPGTNLLSKNSTSSGSSTPSKSDDNVTSPSSQEDR
ncbi:uncharacterized protein LOC123300583 [Chrysoperla carnea]|uniref:uncharacterized protein LOC123300583 n=1 Tax=Chrysoperla carnea TaxID=189513 RepID=UPI001D07AF3C|nr:uncharacterized protein LOC123300583 [Chrysoperla carnea]